MPSTQGIAPNDASLATALGYDTSEARDLGQAEADVFIAWSGLLMLLDRQESFLVIVSRR